MLKLVTLLLTLATSAPATEYYVGLFISGGVTGATSCGTAKATACATITDWNNSTARQTLLVPGDNVNFVAGNHTWAAGQNQHCVLLDRKTMGVVYRGRNSTDTGPGRAIIDTTTGQTIDSPCFGYGVKPTAINNCGNLGWTQSQDYSDFTLQSITLKNNKNQGAYLCAHDNYPARNVTFIDVKLEQTAGAFIGRLDSGDGPEDANCKRGGRDLTNFTWIGTEVNASGITGPAPITGGTAGFPGGLDLACVEGNYLENLDISHTYTLPNVGLCVPGALPDGCDNQDGINLFGATYGIIRNVRIHDVGEDGLDIGGHPPGKSHHWLVENSEFYDNPTSNIKISGGQHAEIRNNYIWGKGIGFETYGAPRFIRFHHNTVWTTYNSVSDSWAFKTFTYQTNSEWAYNIFVAAGALVNQVGAHGKTDTNPTNKWHNNVLYNGNSSGKAMAEYAGIVGTIPRCDGWETGHPTAGELKDAGNYSLVLDSGTGYNPPPLPCLEGRPAIPADYPATAQGLLDWTQAGERGEWFGPQRQRATTTTYDRSWGRGVTGKPLIVTDPPSSRAHLQLQAGDTVAKPYGIGAQVP